MTIELSEIRNVKFLGRDSYILAAIIGSLAKAAYGIPEKIKEKHLKDYLYFIRGKMKVKHVLLSRPALTEILKNGIVL
ncbi:putative nucleotidyltransferase [Clostridium punense]|uniref:Nucleotidyltransferase n=1 Tax=Clostridium punense TaxID=1054297 RepID=A0ABS4K541_9CLOT|nr:hypothetical protein [Clostridium punense]EQB86115.1 hypothetical protein M918_15480 [Clostridium sp. BL8]MBP2022901.1 putative nucleotidyltransferase [Clostridium punense]